VYLVFSKKNIIFYDHKNQRMSSDCGQYSGANNCRFSNAASAYMSMEDAYNEQEYPSPAMALFDYCPKGKNASQANQIPAFESQPFGSFNQPAPVSGQDQPPSGDINWAK